MPAATELVPAARPFGPYQLLQRYPLVSYFVIAFAFTAVYDLLVLVPFPDAPTVVRDFGPCAAALVVTAATAGRPGLKRLLQRLVMWRVGLRWYAFALLGIPAIYTIGILTVPGALSSFTMPTVEWLLLPGLLGFAYTLVLGGPLFEEPGWRGFALAPLQRRWGPLTGSVMLGLGWAAWHLTEYTSSSFAATNGGLTAQGFGTFALVLISFSVIVTWVFNKTRGSLLMAIVLHTTLNWSQLLTSSLFPAAGTNEVGPLIALGSMALILTVVTRGRLGYVRVAPLSAETAAALA